MKKRILKNKVDIINCVILGLMVCFVGLIITRFKYEYGSVMDWETQHYEIPNYFRTYFYETGDLLPDFAMNLGGGQNIYNYSYYGLLSPIILFSYLLPFVTMKTYIQVASLLGVVASVVLVYIWLRNKYTSKVAFYASFLFTCASPLIFHSHRHIMFVNYMPFLVLALIGVDRYFKDNKKKLMLIINVFLIIMSSYFFSIGAILAITLYAVCVYIKTQPEVKFKGFMIAALKYAGLILTSIAMAGILLLPTLYTLLNGRSETNGTFDYKNILIPSFNGTYILYTTYSIGLTSVMILAIIYGFMSGMRHLRLTSTVITLITFFPAFIYGLNGTMYIDPKVLIPFLPVCAYLIASFADKMLHDVMKVHQLIKWALIANLVLFVTYTGDKGLYYALDILASIYLVYLYQIRKMKLFFPATAMVALVMCVSVNFSDDLVEAKAEDEVVMEEVSGLVDEICTDDFSDYRIGNSVLPLKNMNKSFALGYNCSTIYSSVSNKYYKNFYYNEICNENPYRNSSMQTQPDNLMFDIYMGQRYLILDNEDIIPRGYELVKKGANASVYENKDVFYLGSVSRRVLPMTVYEELEYPYNVVALLLFNCVEDDYYEEYTGHILNDTTIEEIRYDCLVAIGTHMREIDISDIYNVADKQIGTGKNNMLNVWIHEMNEFSDSEERYNKKISMKFDEAYNDIVFVSFDVDNSNYLDDQGYSYGPFQNGTKGTDKSKDVVVKVNGCSNKLTNPNWKYYNNNTSFHYCLGENKAIDRLEFTFYDGEYTVSDFKAYKMYYDRISQMKEDTVEFVIDKENSKADKICGKVDVPFEKGIFTMSLPYDEGFKVYIDGEEAPLLLVDTAFIGVRVDNGVHDIEIKYESPFKQYGMYMSIFGIIVFSGIVLHSLFLTYKGRQKPK